MRQGNGKYNKRILIAIFLLLSIALIIWLQGRYINMTPEAIQGRIISYGWYAPFVFLVLALIRPLVFFPITVYYLASGLAFGSFWGGIIACIGAMISALVAYLVAYNTGTKLLSDTWAVRILGIKKRIENRGFRNMLLIRLVPMLSFDLVSYAAGLARLRLRQFLIATIVGTTPRIFAYTLVGASVLDADSYQFWVAIIALFLIFVVPLLLYNRYKNDTKSEYIIR